ncbi:MAG TPA: DUF4388 domain-containing protein [Actinomycetota bacterium]|nr:DUF4388 domain-containing protein [Actinomycetota bacterium]
MLTGTLDDFTLPDVLRLIGSARRTGRLDVTRDAGSGRLFFRDGDVRAAGDARDVAFDLMRWGDGEFSWEPGAAGPAGGDGISVEDLLEHVARRLDELAEIKTLVPSEEAVLVMAPQPPEGAVQINISPSEWRVLVMVDGHRPVRDIALAAGLDDIATMKVLYGLAAAGLVRLAEGAAAVPEPEPDRDVGVSAEASDMTDMTVVSDVSDTPREEDVVAAAPEPEPFAAPEPEPFVEPAPDPEPQPAAVATPEPAAVAQPEPPPDPFLDDAVSESAFPGGFGTPPFGDTPEVDRSTAARELAGLFDEADVAGLSAGGTFVASPPAPPRPRRIEDDDQVTRGLISRLIDGVKGL